MIAVAEADVAAASTGDRAAFTRLVHGTCGLVCAIAYAHVRDVASSEDVAQDVFTRVWQALPRLRNPSSFLPWLRQTTRNAAVSHLRRRREVAVPAQLDAPDPTPDAAIQLAARQEQRMVAAALDELPDEAREVLALFYREGESVAQVAGLLDLSEEAVRKRLSRARSRLRADLVGRLGEVLRAGRPGAGFVALAAASAFGSVAEAAGPPVVLAAAGAKAGGLAALVAGLSGAAGVLFGYLYYRRRCVDESQRRALRRLTLANLALVVLLAVLFVPMRRLAPGWGDIGVLLAFLAGMGWINLVELPRRLPITRRDKLLNWLGLAAGLAAVVLVVVTRLV